MSLESVAHTLPSPGTQRCLYLSVHVYFQANKRLKGAKSEDPHFPKAQFPSAFHCPKCHDDTLAVAAGAGTAHVHNSRLLAHVLFLVTFGAPSARSIQRPFSFNSRLF